MAIGTLTASNAEAVISYVKADTTVDYIDPSVDIFLDYDSKNREFYFTVSLAEAHEFVIVKPALSDAFTLSDVLALQPLKSPSDSITVSDAAAKVLAKYIADGFAVDDGVLIDKDYTGTKGNVATMSDILGLSYGDVVADSYSMSDVVAQVWNYVRTFNDPFVLNDCVRNPLGTFILNTSPLNASDSQFALYKGNDQVDTFGISDTAALTPGKNFTDAFTFSDTDNYSLGKGASDSISCTDYLYIDFKTLTDSLSLSEVLANHFSKNSSDTATVSDTINLSYITGGVLNASGVQLNNTTLN